MTNDFLVMICIEWRQGRLLGCCMNNKAKGRMRIAFFPLMVYKKLPLSGSMQTHKFLRRTLKLREAGCKNENKQVSV